MSPAHQIAVGVSILSALLALTMALVMGLLILRRRRIEAGARLREENELAASRALLHAISGTGDETALAGFPPETKRAAVTRLMRLVRGGDRDRLLALAEQEGLFAEAIAELGSPRPARRIDAMRLLEQFGSPACVAGLDECLRRDRVPAVRLEAAAALARLGLLPRSDAVIEALNLEHRTATRLDAALFRSLAVRDKAQLGRLACADDYRHIRPLLVEALGWTEDFRMATALAGHAADPDPEVRCAAIRAARHLGHPAAAAWIVPLLDDPAEPVRVQAAQACGQFGAREAVPALERLATEPAWWVRVRARAALDTLRPGGRASLSLVGGEG